MDFPAKPGSAPDGGRAAVLTTAALARGDHIEASYKGTFVYRGQVTDIAPGRGLFWFTDQVGAGRRLLDIAVFDVVRLPRQHSLEEPAASASDHRR